MPTALPLPRLNRRLTGSPNVSSASARLRAFSIRLTGFVAHQKTRSRALRHYRSWPTTRWGNWFQKEERRSRCRGATAPRRVRRQRGGRRPTSRRVRLRGSHWLPEKAPPHSGIWKTRRAEGARHTDSVVQWELFWRPGQLRLPRWLVPKDDCRRETAEPPVRHEATRRRPESKLAWRP